MAAQVTQSILSKKLSQTTVQEASKHARDAIDFGIQRLPGGVLNGVAKLVECCFQEVKPDSKFKKADGSSAVGEVIFRAAGIAMTPDSVPQPDGSLAKVAGLQTSIIVPIFDTKDSKGKVTTQAENFLEALNEMKKLADNQNLFPEVVTGEIAEAVAGHLKRVSETKPLYFRFTTSSGRATPQYPTPRVWENWHGSRGVADWQPATTAAQMVQDNNPKLQSPPIQQPAPQPVQQPIAQPAPVQPPPPSTPTTTTTAPGQPEDISALIHKAKGAADNPETAVSQNRLAALAIAAGHSKEKVDDTQTWEEVAGLIANPVHAAQPDATPHVNGQAVGPAKGDVWKYTQIPVFDPKTKRQAINADGRPRFRSADVEVVSVNADGTYDLVDLNDKVTPYKANHVSDLEPA